jgi:hypothetical protein
MSENFPFGWIKALEIELGKGTMGRSSAFACGSVQIKNEIKVKF